MKQIQTFKILSDETRLRMLALMAMQGELCVCELVHALELSQPKISRHLANLRKVGIVSSRRHAQWIFYNLDPEMPAWERHVVDAAVEGIQHETIVRKDAGRLANMDGRPQHGPTR
ncbi:MAG TPA: metalloregulator ArsR/SmtB family transcription factor [Hellea balneolensis]|uniref:Metalloregulator ArsR/SmtB family transcription factor n=1 Tax=Hellea balneolensis TaxID=287478 RepID=A0A7C3GCB5_9PROT|nr:metalloregulator ArsR/SmtB family transcription factor [Hellea balneolensis]